MGKIRGSQKPANCDAPAFSSINAVEFELMPSSKKVRLIIVGQGSSLFLNENKLIYSQYFILCV
jgi:putative NADH-flavin reductase